jgi:hypothetical protein
MKRGSNMELTKISPELDELRKVIISSNLTTCYLILDELGAREAKTTHYEKFKASWIDIYRDTYKLVSKMKIRKRVD